MLVSAGGRGTQPHASPSPARSEDFQCPLSHRDGPETRRVPRLPTFRWGLRVLQGHLHPGPRTSLLVGASQVLGEKLQAGREGVWRAQGLGHLATSLWNSRVPSRLREPISWARLPRDGGV